MGNSELIIFLFQAMQIPLVFLICILSFKAAKTLKVKEFVWVSIAFIFHLIYLVLIIFITNQKLFEIHLIKSENNNYILNSFTIITSLCFIIGILLRIKINKNLTLILFLTAIGIAAYCLLGFIYQVNVKVVKDIFYSLSLFGMFYFFTRKGYFGRITKYSSKLFLSAGFFLWALPSLAVLFEFIIPGDDFSFTILMFAIAFIAKTFIFIGIFYLYQEMYTKSLIVIEMQEHDKNQYSKYSEFVEEILKSTFHEITLPMAELSHLIEETSRKIPREFRTQFSYMEQTYERIKAILIVAKNSYMKDKSLENESSEFDNKNIVFKDNRLSFQRINYLIEVAIQSFKNTYTDTYFELQYGASCIVECVPSEMVQVLLNLFKNAYEASFEKPKKIIKVRSYRITEGFSESGKYVIVEIEDHGIGVSSLIYEKIWERGFSTKTIDDSNIIRGEGLHIVKNLIKKYSDASIKIESPIQNLKENNIMGTLVKLKFKNHTI